MKSHTSEFKTQLTELGRELRGVITYGNTTLEDEINSITPHYEADILKSVMKQLDLELTVDIPLNTIINCQIGILVNGSYEMLNYGNYVVYNSEKQEDTNTYKITCYDKLLYSMKQNEDLGITYPITIKNYLIALGNKIGLSVASGTFYNQDLQIPSELYLGQEYTYRDILDEIAQATGSIICLNENDEIVIKYPTLTNDTIDEDYLKDINVDFGQKYGVINSIVLSRSGESDNVYLRDEESVVQNGLTEVKIVDNQIMNFNNRSDYLQGILNALNGLYYYLNDFNSTGILYYEVGDLYNVQIGENTYQCLMLNDEVNVTTGIEEIIHTDMPEKSETDYSKADKTDMRINKTYLIVDKQNQQIESVVNNVTEQNNKISQITQTVDEINSKISDIADITKAEESNNGIVNLTEINASEPIMIKIKPTYDNIDVRISYRYPTENVFYPNDGVYMPNRLLRFKRTYVEDEQTKIEYIDYELPDDLLYYDSTHYDEFYLDYDSQTCQVIKRCRYIFNESVRPLTNETVTDYPYPEILLGDGDYEISIISREESSGYGHNYLFARLMAQNIYTTQFYTKFETNSQINQKADEINLEVSQTLTNYSTTNEMNSAITLKANEITSTVSNTYETKDNARTNYSQIRQTADNISSVVSTKVGEDEIISKINQSSEAVTIDANKIKLNGKTIDLTGQDIKIVSTNFNVNKDGNMTCKNANVTGKITATSGKIADYTIDGAQLIGNNVGLSGKSGQGWAFWAGSNDAGDAPYRVGHSGSLYATDANIKGVVNATSGTFNGSINIRGSNSVTTYNSSGYIANRVNNTGLHLYNNNGGEVGYVTAGSNKLDGVTYSTIALHNNTGGRLYVYPEGIFVVGTVHTTSLESEKKNIELYEKNALDEILQSEIYNYHFKNEDENNKKHIGLVIGGNYKTSKEVTNESGVDLYSMIAVAWKAIQEQQEQIEQMKKEIKELKGEK